MLPRPPPIKKWPLKIRLTAAALLLTTSFLVVGMQSARTGQPRFVALDIGQGDALYIRTPAGQDILIDGGPSKKTTSVLKSFMPPGDKKIDAVIATHLDADHSGGLAQVLQDFEVAAVITNGAEPKTKTAQAFFEAIRAEGLEPRVVSRGQRLAGQGWTAEVVWPAAAISSKETNEEGIVVRLKTGRETLLLTSDISSRIEQKLLEQHTPLRSSILKVGHHGSKTSTSENLIRSVRPRDAVISVGKGNRYGHPTSEVLERLRAQSIDTIRTDESGSIVINL